MASHYGTLQWYQSRRSSAAHQKNEKEIEVETGNYPLRHYNQHHQGYSEICGIDSKNFGTRVMVEAKSVENVHEPKNFHERIDQTMAEIRRLVADLTSKKSNYSDFSSNSVSKQQSTFARESLHLSDTKSMRNFQVSLESGTSEFHKQYTVYSSYELNEKRDRGLCIWCDEFWYIGHDCCKNKNCYVLDIDVDDAIEVNESDPIESRVDVTFVDENESHCKKKLMKDCVENESNVLSKITCDVETENRESSEVLGKHYEEEKNELQVFDELPKQDLSQNIAERCKSYSLAKMPKKCEINFEDYDNKRLGILYDVEPWCLVVSTTTNIMCLDDVCIGEWMAILITNPSSKDVGSLHKLHEMFGAQSWVVEWPEPPLPPPEPPPRMI